MDDSPMYTGVDGVFGNEITNTEVKERIQEQERLLQELTPQLEEIIAIIDAEKASVVEAISNFVDQSLAGEKVDVSEIKAAARYRKYLENFKNVFVLKLNEAKR